MPSVRRRTKPLDLTDTRGTASVEYAVVMLLVSVLCAAATVALYPRSVALFRVQTLVLGAPAIL